MEATRSNAALVLSLIALVMASAGTGYAALGDAGRGDAVTTGNSRGEGVEIGVRNRSRGETGLITSSDGYSLRLSNTKVNGGGGAVYGCRAPDAPAAQNLACLYADNLRGGKAFLFRSQEGASVGHFDLGNPAGPPFTTNATGLVTNLNADKVDGLDASQLQGQTGPQGPAGPAGPAGAKGDPGPTVGEWTGGFCNPTSATFIPCVDEDVDFPAPGRALLVATGSWQGPAAPLSGRCLMEVDGASTGFPTSFGAVTNTFTGGLAPAKNGTFAMTSVTNNELAAGSHNFAVECSEGDGDISMNTIQLSIVGLGGA